MTARPPAVAVARRKLRAALGVVALLLLSASSAAQEQPSSVTVRRTSLSDAVANALAKNPTYETALLEIRRADAVVQESKAGWLPTVYGNASLTHLDGNRAEAGTLLLAQNELAGNVTVTVPLVMTRQWFSDLAATLR